MSIPKVATKFTILINILLYLVSYVPNQQIDSKGRKLKKKCRKNIKFLFYKNSLWNCRVHRSYEVDAIAIIVRCFVENKVHLKAKNSKKDSEHYFYDSGLNFQSHRIVLDYLKRNSN